MFCIHDELEPGMYLAHTADDAWLIVYDVSPFALVTMGGFASEAEAREAHAEMAADYDNAMARAMAPLN